MTVYPAPCCSQMDPSDFGKTIHINNARVMCRLNNKVKRLLTKIVVVTNDLHETADALQGGLTRRFELRDILTDMSNVLS